MDQLFGELQNLIVQVTQLADILWPFGHPKDVVVLFITTTVNPLTDLWNGFVLSTTDVEGGRNFIDNATIALFEPKLQLACDSALVLVVMWAAFRIMWGHGLFTQYTARILLPRLFMTAVLINFCLPLFQMVVDASNVFSGAAQSMVGLDGPSTVLNAAKHGFNDGALEVITTAVLAVGYDVFAITYIARYAILIVLAITAPIAGLVFLLPDTQHLSKLWVSHFTTNLFMQPAQLFVLAIGFALERQGVTPVHHLFAMASLLIAYKVPGAFGGSEKAAHKLQSTLTTTMNHMVHALAKA